MTVISEILEMFRTLSSAEQLSIAHSIVDILAKKNEKEPSEEAVLPESLPPDLFPKAPSDTSVIKCLTLIRQNEFLSDLNFEEIVKKVGSTLETISRRCNKDIGITLKEAIDLIRLEKCKSQIAESSFSISSIAFDQGFEDYSTFFRQFKSRYGSPRKYRQDCMV